MPYGRLRKGPSTSSSERPLARDDDGHTHGLLIVGMDITKRKLTEVELERAEARC